MGYDVEAAVREAQEARAGCGGWTGTRGVATEHDGGRGVREIVLERAEGREGATEGGGEGICVREGAVVTRVGEWAVDAVWAKEDLEGEEEAVDGEFEGIDDEAGPVCALTRPLRCAPGEPRFFCMKRHSTPCTT